MIKMLFGGRIGATGQYLINLLVFTLFVFCTISCSENQTVTVTGEFPEGVEAYAKLTVEKNGEKWQYKSPILEGMYKFEIDSVDTGVCELAIEWSTPFDKRYRKSRNKEGDVVEKYSPKGFWRSALYKKFYINPDQSQTYHVQFENDVNEEIIDEMNGHYEYRTDLYRLIAISESEDAQLYEKLDSIKAYYTENTYYLTLDSLYKSSDQPNRLYRDFTRLAKRLNTNHISVPYIDKRLEIIGENADNPVSVLDMLSMESRSLMAEKDMFNEVVDGMEGRAKNSSYYATLSSKLAEMDEPLGEGDAVPVPTGHTPDYIPFAVDYSDHLYSLIVFWVSWYEPNRLQNAKWNKLLSRYKNKGFQIIGVSLDEDVDDWEEAIKEGHLTEWLHTSDIGQGFAGDNVIRHGVQSIPHTVLVDQQGRLVSKNSKPEAVAEFLMKNL